MNFRNNKEVDFLLQALQCATGNKKVKTLAEIQPKDWHKLFKLSTDHGVSPLLFSLLSKQKEIPVPSQILAVLKYQYLHNLKDNITKTTQLVKILTFFKSRGIKMIPFKGPVIAELAYGDLALRAFSDVDVLIKANDFLKVYDLLKQKDWKPATLLSEKTKRLWVRSRRDLEFVSSNCVMDCHQQLTQGPRFFSQAERIMAETHDVILLNQNFSTLSPEYTVISICLNGTKDQWTSLKPIADLTLFLSRTPQLNWDQLMLDAKKMGTQKILLLGLNLCKKLLAYSPPCQVVQAIEAYPVVNHLTRQIINRIFIKKPNHRMFYRFLFMFKLLDNCKFRLAYLSHFLFSPTPRDFSLIPLPESLYPLYYLIRPLRVGASSIYFAIKTLIHGSWEPAADGSPANRE